MTKFILQGPTHQVALKLSFMKLKVVGHCLLLDHMTQGSQIVNSNLRETTGLQSRFVHQKMSSLFKGKANT